MRPNEPPGRSQGEFRSAQHGECPMSMATRCIACGTIFRVVQDQLKVSEGWVRCGRCNGVFNALEGLFDLGRDAPALAEPSERAAPLAHAGASGGPSARTTEPGSRGSSSAETTRSAPEGEP